MPGWSGSDLGPFEHVRGLGRDAPIPHLVPVRRVLRSANENDPAAATRREMERLRPVVKPGTRVAITAGSRGNRDLAIIIRAAGEWLRDIGADPFAVTAMGSHGGATAAGQRKLLAELGITEASVGMSILATMDTVELAGLPDGPTVHLDAYAAAADAILLVNRVKPHTDFCGPVESGLAKICAVGLGNQSGAESIHAHGASRLGHWVPTVAREVVRTGRVLGGLALLENADYHTARIAFLEADEIGDDGEAQLLDEARRLMGTLPFDELDVLVVDELGKDKSGTGLDTNVIGRRMIRGAEEFGRPRIANVSVHSISPASHGNATGLGLADFVPLRVIEQIDLRATYVNAMTAGIAGLQRAQIPIVLPTDRDAIAAAILTCGRPDAANARLVRIHDTLDLTHLWVSESLGKDVEGQPDLEIVDLPSAMSFDHDGNLL